MKKKSTFIRIFKIMKKTFIPYTIGLLFASASFLLIQIFLSKMFMGMFNAIADKDLTGMLNAIKSSGVYTLIIFILFPFFSYMIERSVAVTTGNIRTRVFSKVQSLPINYFKKRHSGDLISRLTNDILEIEKAYSNYFANFFATIVAGVGTLIYIFILEWRLGILTVAGGGLTLLVNIYYAKILKVISVEVQEKLSKLNERLTDLLEGMPIIKSFNIANIILNKYNEKNKEVYKASYNRANKMAVISGINSIIGIFSFGAVTALGSYLAIKGYMAVGVIVAVVQLQNGVRALTRTLGTFISEIQGSLAAGDRVFEVLDEEEEPDSYEIEKKYKIAKQGEVEFNNVTFSYDEETVLDKLTFSVPKGKVYALAGPSGGGKSTIFKLLLNFYPPSEGNISIKGKSIGEQKIKDIRKGISYVPQDAYLFAGTIIDNIRQGNQDATFDEVKMAAKKANAHDFIENMENGYDTFVGEKGAKLSGGQKQRIAIARAILKDAPILLLDEATSALDTESEKLVQQALNKLMVGTTTLVIAHRLSTIEDADEILVLKDGSIAERGSHKELLELEGIYKGLYDQQFGKKEKVAI
ncbi:ABC transporter ATP-binding protein [Dethiothermospora halolimnae]|uniref:ABC transporter ATP-binding protein n=1 Tax=Dethiothermospora halolimnae TaxID=3114390 RepID=UPI003CCB88DC